MSLLDFVSRSDVIVRIKKNSVYALSVEEGLSFSDRSEKETLININDNIDDESKCSLKFSKCDLVFFFFFIEVFLFL